MNKLQLDLQLLVRPNILHLTPYRCARDDYSEGVLLDANECSYGSCIPMEGDMHRYPSPYNLDLKEKIAKYRGVRKEQIFLGVGSDEAIDMVVRVFCTPGEGSLLITPPTYGMYKVVADINNIKVISVPLTEEFHLQADKVLEAVTPQTHVIFLCSPNNPTGNTLATDSIIALLERFHGIVVVDEAYVDFSSSASLCYLLDRYPRLIILQTFSKAFGLAGVRFGMAIAHEDIIAIFNKVKFPYNVSKLTAAVAHKALDNVHLMEANVKCIVEQKQRIVEELKKLPTVRKIFPSDSNYILVRIDHAQEIYKKMASEKGVVIRYQGGKIRCEDCVRITVGTPEQNDILLKTLKNTIDEVRQTSNGSV
ncbi:histidinol-phosphate aminotransferase-like [Oculina patagonica]